MPVLQVTDLSVKATDISYIGQRIMEVKEILPFRIKFTNIGISGYSGTYPAPLGLAIIGFSNYIL